MKISPLSDTNMSSSEGESIFLTHSKFRDKRESVHTDNVLSDVLDIEKENPNMMPNFNLKSNVFSDISDEEIVNASQDVENIERFLKPLQQNDLDDLIRKGLSKNTESKCSWALNLFLKNGNRTERGDNQTQTRLCLKIL